MKKQKDKTFAFRISSADLSKIKTLAKRVGMTVTNYLVACVLNKKITIISGLDEWLAEMKAQGRNLSQLVMRTHMGQSDPALAEKLFPGYECVVATHSDTYNVHSHIIVNSTSFQDGKKKKRCFTPGEYHAAQRGKSWKFALIKAIEDALLYSPDRESFIQNMEYEGYQVQWSDARKHITYTCSNGMKCRDNKLHDETYLKENLEKPFAHRQATGFVPLTPETPEGWLGELERAGRLAEDVVSFGRNLERAGNAPPLPAPRTWTDSKQRQREGLKKLAQGHKLQSEQEQEFAQKM